MNWKPQKDSEFKGGSAQQHLVEQLNKGLDGAHKLPANAFSGGFSIDEMRRGLKGAMKHIDNFHEKNLSELISADATGQTAKVLSTVWDAAFESNIGRELVAVITESKQRTVKIPKDGRPAYRLLAHGMFTDGPDTGKEPTFVEISVQKFGARIPISKDMIDDAEFSVIQRQLKMLGQAWGEFETNRIVDAMVADAGQSVAAAGTLTTAKVVEAWRLFQRFPGGGTRQPSHLVISPEHYEDMTADTSFQNILFHRPDLSGQDKMNGVVGFLPGNLKVMTHPAVAADTSIMIAKDTAGVYLVRQDLNIEELDDPLHDIVNGKASIRAEYGTIEANSIVKLAA